MASTYALESNQVYAAKHVYLLMKKEYRISRNIRALWYLQHLNKILVYKPRNDLAEESEELTVLSIIPRQDDVKIELGQQYQFIITAETLITFISRRYRLVFALDLSPSSASVDLCSGEVLYDEVLTTLQNCLLGLVQPFTLPGSFLVLTPQIYVSVIASTPLNCSTNLVLAQGMLITRDNVHQFVQEAKDKLIHMESGLVREFNKVLRCEENMDHDGITLTGGLFTDIVEPPSSPIPPDILSNPEPCFVNMLRYGILALQLLPENTSAGIIIITDGMVGLPDATVFESLMVQLRNGTIACSFLLLGSSRSDSCQLGHIPHVELLQFIATATFGAYFSTCPVLTDTEPSMNVYHQAFFCWNFQKGLDGFKIEDLPDKNVDELTEDLAWRNSPCVPPNRQGLKWQNLSPVVRKKHVENPVHASIGHIMSLRLREGYTIKETQVTKDGTELVVKLVLPWRDFVRMEYVASTTWPLDFTNLLTHTEIILEGSWEFLHDVTCPMKKPFRSVYRTAVVKKFWQTLQRILETDRLLVHLQSFSSNLDYYNIPDSIKNGVPLFYVQANSQNPCLSLQHSSKLTLRNGNDIVPVLQSRVPFEVDVDYT